jgi:hypothetical protein
MNSRRRLWLGAGAGALIAVVDNVLFHGEASPIVVVGLLLVTTGAAGAAWGKDGWLPALAAWIWLPGVHLVKRILDLPDTIHPNTYQSIVALAAFSLGVAAVGTLAGVALRRGLHSGPADRAQ